MSRKNIKFTALALVAVLAFTLAGCGSSGQESTETAGDQTTATDAAGNQTTATDAAGDQSDENSAGQTAASSQNQGASADTASSETESVGIHHAQIEIEDYGTVVVELDGDTAPITVENFIGLVEDGFYDGLTFHRIIDGFMIQGGDPAQSGSDKTADSIVGEFSDNGYDNDIRHTEGVISMARTSDPNSASSQFFIMVGDADYLDGQYAAFGYVTEGYDIVKQIAEDAEPTDNNGTIPYDAQPVIESITMID